MKLWRVALVALTLGMAVAAACSTPKQKPPAEYLSDDPPPPDTTYLDAAPADSVEQ